MARVDDMRCPHCGSDNVEHCTEEDGIDYWVCYGCDGSFTREAKKCICKGFYKPAHCPVHGEQNKNGGK